MNKTKKVLIILSIIFAIADIGWSIYDVVQYFMTPSKDRAPIFNAIYSILLIGVCIAIVVLLIMSIWKNGKLFRQRYGLYMTALVLSVIVNLLSISTILLVVTMFISDWVWVKPKDEAIYHKVDSPNSSEHKQEIVKRLKEMKDNGEITEEQFQEEIMKLL